MPRKNLAEVETLLNRLGYLASAPDGAITPETRAVVRRFQADIGAPANGFISPTLLAALRINSGLGPSIVVAAPVIDGAVAPVAEPDENADDRRGGGTGGGGGWN
ncbi:MAG: peptidoglycan-binding protein [Rhodobacteraceae bacterium]|nr:peptidoglycan-binding protein [Paracoccaceae bacterium]